MMGNYLDKWKTLFPEVVGGTKRPLEAISDQDEFNTNGFPQFIAQDPVRYDLQNAFLKQFLSNDAWLWVRQQQADKALDRHKDDAQAHPNGVSGNAASASKLSTARKINITGNATGSATFDGTSDINIRTTVNESKHAVNADVAKTLETTDANGVKNNATLYWVGKDGQPTWLWGVNKNPSETYVYNPANFHVAAANNDGNGANIANTYLKKSGGNMSGPLNFANGTWNLVGDDSYMGGHDISGTFCIKGANGETGIALVNKGNESDYARISYGGGNINFNKKIGGNLAGNADTATTANAAKMISGFYDTDNGEWGNCAGTYVAGFKEKGEGAIQWRAEGGSLYEKIDGTFWQREGAYEVIDTSTVNNYAPTKTGVGASGTWGISISGNAASATNADTVDGYHASDIINRISAANTGGIVAASLTENGYVKFANGLILQWGSHSNTSRSWYHYTFPIAFSTVFDVIDEYSTKGTESFYGYSKNITNTGFDMYIDNSETGRYIAIGI